MLNRQGSTVELAADKAMALLLEHLEHALSLADQLGLHLVGAHTNDALIALQGAQDIAAGLD